MTHADNHSKTLLGFWIYMLSDVMMFASIFATYLVLRNSTCGGPTAATLFHLPYTFVQTLLFLCASFTVGLGGAFAHRKNVRGVFAAFSITFLFGLSFLAMQFLEFHDLIKGGNGWEANAFLSAFFTLGGTLAFHVIFGLLWIIVLLSLVARDRVITAVSITRLSCLRIFWQVINIVWLFIFAIVYVLGVSL